MILVYANVFWIRPDAIENACPTVYNAGYVQVAFCIDGPCVAPLSPEPHIRTSLGSIAQENTQGQKLCQPFKPHSKLTHPTAFTILSGELSKNVDEYKNMI